MDFAAKPHLLEKLQSYAIILGSTSPRRSSLFQGLNIPFTVKSCETDESFPENLTPHEVAIHIALQKANTFLKNELSNKYILITADTIVCVNNEILGKPKNETDAIRMLQKLSGKKHEVITGIVITSTSIQQKFSVQTNVHFKTLSIDEIIYYVQNYRPFDKAGAYGIQEWIGYIGITQIEGSYFNVMGLPVHQLYKELDKFIDMHEKHLK
jgi:septum formation protein